jgi:hypothetical protein
LLAQISGTLWCKAAFSEKRGEKFRLVQAYDETRNKKTATGAPVSGFTLFSFSERLHFQVGSVRAEHPTRRFPSEVSYAATASRTSTRHAPKSTAYHDIFVLRPTYKQKEANG